MKLTRKIKKAIVIYLLVVLLVITALLSINVIPEKVLKNTFVLDLILIFVSLGVLFLIVYSFYSIVRWDCSNRYIFLYKGSKEDVKFRKWLVNNLDRDVELICKTSLRRGEKEGLFDVDGKELPNPYIKLYGAGHRRVKNGK
jgi:hypothetical protein